ncbi:hypothetical protein [Streptodolium elevatio]|uniref:Uncharacterized protein n=1 Tax=Streptodolium elevatio TaxID=3157996 RepID=A0ABV3DW51_9ACTN
MWTDELDAMAEYGCLFNLTNHPFLTGRPSRAVALRQLIEQGLARGDVRFLRCRDVARHSKDDPDLPTRHPLDTSNRLNAFPERSPDTPAGD